MNTIIEFYFAQIMLEKGYVTSYRQAFDEYLDESAKGYVYRREPPFAEGVARIRQAGGNACRRRWALARQRTDHLAARRIGERGEDGIGAIAHQTAASIGSDDRVLWVRDYGAPEHGGIMYVKPSALTKQIADRLEAHP